MLARILWNYGVLLRSSRLKTEELVGLQDRKLRQLIRYVYDNVPFYHEQLKSAGISPEDFRGTADLKLLPILTRSDVSANFPDRITSRRANSLRAVSTSGTTGKPLKIIYDSYVHDTQTALKMRRFHFMGAGVLDRLVAISYVGSPAGVPYTKEGAPTATTTLSSKLHFLKMSLQFVFGTYGSKREALRHKTLGLGNYNSKEIANALLKLKPDIIHSRGSYLRRLASTMEEQGQKLQVRRIVVSGEAVSSTCKRELAEAFDAEVFEGCGASEFAGLAHECQAHAGLHLYADCYIFELLKQNGEIVLATETNLRKERNAELLITCLYNKAMPLIRYRIGDIVQMEDGGACECGSTLPRLRKIDGKVRDGLRNYEGVRISPGEIVDHLESAFGLRNFQLIQQEDMSLSVKLKEKDLSNEHLVQPLLEYLYEILGGRTSINLSEWENQLVPQKYVPVYSKAGAVTEIKI